ncbi:MAG: hypothetical protein MJZ52_04540 [Bacteroidales bacterium]|nr:hypothetical protein [Bacteroidales bacterium]
MAKKVTEKNILEKKSFTRLKGKSIEYHHAAADNVPLSNLSWISEMRDTARTKMKVAVSRIDEIGQLTVCESTCVTKFRFFNHIID